MTNLRLGDSITCKAQTQVDVLPWKAESAGPKNNKNERILKLGPRHDVGLFFVVRAGKSNMAVGQNQWHHFGVGAPPILVDFSADWDVH